MPKKVVMLPGENVWKEAEDEGTDEDADLLGGALPPLPLLRQTSLLHAEGQEQSC